MDATLDHERCYRALASRDARFDGTFVTSVRTTGIYCRPSCPAVTPKRSNVQFFRTAAAAQRAGFRACRRCRPDAVPGDPEWNVRQDVVGRAMRLVTDGAVDRLGVAGVAETLGYSQRHLNRLVTDELGVGLSALARSQRAHTARILLETTELPASQVAWAAGFGSIRSFNDTILGVYGRTPTALREAARGRPAGARPGSVGNDEPRPGGTRPDGSASGGIRPLDVPAAPGARLRIRLAARQPFDGARVLAFVGRRVIPGVEAWDGTTYRRSLDLPRGHATVACTLGDGSVLVELVLADVRDLAPAVARVRRMLDLDADPQAVAEVLGADPLLAPLVRARPGLRMPIGADPREFVVRGIVGQQVSLSGAATVAGRLVAALGSPLTIPDPVLTHVFPTPAQLAEADPAQLPMPRARAAALVGTARALADGVLVLDPGSDRASARRDLLARRGVGPWTADYVLMRGLGDPDVLLATDLGVRRAVAALGADSSPSAIERLAHSWRPWRSYAVAHLWTSLESVLPAASSEGSR